MSPTLQKCFSSKPLISNNLPPNFKPKIAFRAAYAVHTELTYVELKAKRQNKALQF